MSLSSSPLVPEEFRDVLDTAPVRNALSLLRSVPPIWRRAARECRERDWARAAKDLSLIVSSRQAFQKVADIESLQRRLIDLGHEDQAALLSGLLVAARERLVVAQGLVRASGIDEEVAIAAKDDIDCTAERLEVERARRVAITFLTEALRKEMRDAALEARAILGPRGAVAAAWPESPLAMDVARCWMRAQTLAAASEALDGRVISPLAEFRAALDSHGIALIESFASQERKRAKAASKPLRIVER